MSRTIEEITAEWEAALEEYVKARRTGKIAEEKLNSLNRELAQAKKEAGR